MLIIATDENNTVFTVFTFVNNTESRLKKQKPFSYLYMLNIFLLLSNSKQEIRFRYRLNVENGTV